MNDGKLVFDVTHVRGFAEDLWHRIGDDGEWGRDLKRALTLIVGADNNKVGAFEDDGVIDEESLRTIGLSGGSYFGTAMGKSQGENLAELIKFADKARRSVRDLAKGAAVIAEKLDDEDANNGKDVEQVYTDFGETAPHGLYGGQT